MMGINQYERDERTGKLPDDSYPEVATQAIAKLAEADGQRPVTLTQEEGVALLLHVSDLDLAAARYRWIRTHQYQGDIDAMDSCQPNSPCALNFDRRIDALRSECP
jgi:hypothetical protein